MGDVRVGGAELRNDDEGRTLAFGGAALGLHASLTVFSKLVIVGLKPTPKTWLRAPREPEEGGGKTKWKGTLSWFPSVSISQGSPKKAVNGKDEAAPATTPILVYTWGNSLRLLKVTEVRGRETVRNPRTGKTTEMEVGRMAFEDAGRWAAPSDILASQWLNANVGSFAAFLAVLLLMTLTGPT